MPVPAAPEAVARTRTSGGARIYTLRLQAFPQMTANAFLVVLGPPEAPGYTALLDAGSGQAASDRDLLGALETVRRDYGECWSWATLSRLIASHAHPDHVGGLPGVARLTPAPLAAHALATPTLRWPGEVQAGWAADVEAQIGWLGAEGALADRTRRRSGNPWLKEGLAVQDLLHGGERLDDVFEVIHTPGHEAGQVCLRIDDVLLSADHLLPHNSPPLMPERYRPFLGLAHYLEALERVERLQGVSTALGGHGGPMPEWRARVQGLRDRYAGKLADLLACADAPDGEGASAHTLLGRLFPAINPAQALLLLDQTAACAEYLAQRGELRARVQDGTALYRRP